MSEAPSKSIETRTIVVTGGADGIGRAVVLLCAARRDNVAILDKNAEAAKKTAAEAMKQGAKCALSLACDVSSEKQIDRKSTRLNSSHGYISYAVFCLKKKKHNQAAEHIEHESRVPLRDSLVLRLPSNKRGNLCSARLVF